ncbi:LytR/AlgR family response regulator transcription factor [Hymenobacter canadensis]|uniref:LytTR family DNA-binding domain-containing protein n=1 Tax=Hymenobacter canadensis TaxID=2999067 RepID=A0ABY7LU72_9BACT|nr:LytTR family DNA-binding domain-containing protein [Hymenobacter canadensis]WBA43954.1 LytTR family DNA-binding domain-containing protein [Hymenobacter canadensis]
MSSLSPAASALRPLTCVVADDNEMNRLALAHYVGITAGLTLAGSFPDGVSCLNYFRAGGQADLLFLDIAMPELTGLELVRLLPQPAPEVVLVTTHRDYALDAFELHVAGYLVKPLDYARFSQTVDRLRTRHEARRPAPAPASPRGGYAELFGEGNALFLKINKSLTRINFDEVLYLEALSTYSVLVTLKQKHIVYATLKTFEERLPFAHFVRVHRSYMVNTRYITSVEDNHLQLPGGHEVPVAKSYQDDFYRRLRGL